MSNILNNEWFSNDLEGKLTFNDTASTSAPIAAARCSHLISIVCFFIKKWLKEQIDERYSNILKFQNLIIRFLKSIVIRFLSASGFTDENLTLQSNIDRLRLDLHERLEIDLYKKSQTLEKALNFNWPAFIRRRSKNVNMQQQKWWKITFPAILRIRIQHAEWFLPSVSRTNRVRIGWSTNKSNAAHWSRAAENRLWFCLLIDVRHFVLLVQSPKYPIKTNSIWCE